MKLALFRVSLYWSSFYSLHFLVAIANGVLEDLPGTKSHTIYCIISLTIVNLYGIEKWNCGTLSTLIGNLKVTWNLRVQIMVQMHPKYIHDITFTTKIWSSWYKCQMKLFWQLFRLDEYFYQHFLKINGLTDDTKFLQRGLECEFMWTSFFSLYNYILCTYLSPFLFIRGLSWPTCIQASLSLKCLKLTNHTWISSQLSSCILWWHWL